MTGQRIVRADTAFSGGPGLKKRPRIENGAHLKFIRNLPCCVTGKRGSVEAAHIRMKSDLYGKREVGGAEKPDDRWAIPLSAEQHRLQHTMNEEEYWKQVGIDPFGLALALYHATGDDEIAEGIIRSHLMSKGTPT
jgi:hypothetical protein